MIVKANCIKETYTWVCDGYQHPFLYVKVGLVYVFNKEEKYEPYRLLAIQNTSP